MVKVEDLQSRTDEQFVLDMLEATGVLVVHGSGFGCGPTDGYFRMVYLADEETIENAGREIKQFLSTRNS